MITAADMAPPAAATPRPPGAAFAAVMPGTRTNVEPFAAGSPAHATPLRERVLLFVIFVTVLASSVAFIEPSPHDALMGLLAVACLVAGVRFDRKVIVLLLLLLIWNAGGLFSLLNVPHREKTIQYAATSVYLGVAAVMWACILAENTMSRIAALRSAYVLTAVAAALAGIAGYFSVFPGAHELFAPNDRALGGFKDPNVFGPFLIWPALVVLERMLVRRMTLLDIGIVGILAVGLLLAFSRGAWLHFAISFLVMVGLTFLTARQARARLRIVVMSGLAMIALTVFIAAVLTIPEIREMFEVRAHLFQSYDVSQGGRFRLQEVALSALLNFPNGMGPFEFAHVYGLQQHNVYLQAFLVYGWIGGMSYILLVLTTLGMGLRSAFVATPWQPYLIAAFATFVGEVAEGLIIDTDHWRHFFLLLGMIWGLWAATVHYQRTAPRLASAYS